MEFIMISKIEPKSSSAFEPEFIELLADMIEEQISFNKLIGLKLSEVTTNEVRCRVLMRPELIGNFTLQRIHGGVISATLDTVAGMAVLVAKCAQHMELSPAQRLRKFFKMGTIDLRVDYLRPGVGPHFVALAKVVRLGSRVATTHMEFLGADGALLATGTSAYIVS